MNAFRSTALTLFLACAATGNAHMLTEKPVSIPSTGLSLGATLLAPAHSGPWTCAVLIGGTLSQTRDGGLDEPGARFTRDALRRLAERLAASDIGSLRWDRRGHGETPAGAGPPGIADDVADVKAAIAFARSRPGVSRVVVVGESAGAYYACLAAKEGVTGDGYIFLGGLASPYRDLYAWNFGGLKAWADRSPDNRAWAEKNAPRDLAMGHAWEALFSAVERGDSEHTVQHGDFRQTMPLARIREQTATAPGEQFRHVKAPCLVLQGEHDLNVPPGDAALIEKALRSAGNKEVTRVIIAGADHSFQLAPDDPDQRMRERFSFASFARPYSALLYSTIANWVRDPASVTSDAGAPAAPERPLRSSIVAWNGIRIVEDVNDAAANPGVETLEGRIGPLLNAEGSAAHYIDMPAGLFLAEHPHATESLIYTVRGNWVLCSGGRRHLMRPGSLFWFKAKEPTGWEVPFDAPAYVLIFKGDPNSNTDEQTFDYLRSLKDRCEKDHAAGTPFLLRELKADHPARVFAREVNPAWEQKLPR